ncbi:MAG: tyrosine-type recombinase/integrase [Clostridia bacterium]|nr:tyrosine-type recombinase/integrase [Clostridia bacterium]
MSERILTQTHLTAFEEYLLKEEKSAATVEKYLRDARAFLIYAEGKEITKELTVAWKKSLEDNGYKPRSINSMLASLNCLLEFMGAKDCKVKNLRIQKQVYLAEEKELTKDEYKRLLAAAKKKEQLNLVIRTICATGIRVSELKYFTVEAIQNGEVSVKCKSKTRTIIVPGDLRKLLLSYAKRKGITEGVIFITRNGKPLDRSYIWSQMKGLCEAAGVNPSKVFPHNLRKLFARTFYGIEKDIAKLADILGHSSIETTRIYIMSTSSEHRRQIERMGLTFAGSYA